MIRRLAVLGVGLLLGGCGILEPGSEAAEIDLAQARALWASAGIEDYDLMVERVCYCASHGTVRVEVRGGRRVAVVPGGDVPLEPTSLSDYPTVEGLFDVVARALEGPADELRVTYHPVIGYPVDLWVDPRRDVDDEEFGYRVELVAPASGG